MKPTQHNPYQLSAAEAHVLLNPNGDNSREALRLLLKEATFDGYIKCYRGTRMVNDTFTARIIGYTLAFIGCLVLVASKSIILAIILAFIFGTVLSVLLAFFLPKVPSKDMLCMEITPKGDHLMLTGEKPIFKQIVTDISTTIQLHFAKYSNCSFDELLKTIKKSTPSGGEFLDQMILKRLVEKELLSVKINPPTVFEDKVKQLSGRSSDQAKEERKLLYSQPRHYYNYTKLGEQYLEQLRQQLDTARTLPTLLRSNPAEAAALALALGGLVLLIPDVQGHFGEVMQLLNQDHFVMDMDEMRRHEPDGSFSSDGGSSSFPEDDNDAKDLDNNDFWNDTNDGSSDFLDGSFDSLDSGFSDSATGDGSDGGCSSDGGGGDGCGGGCGGD
jgi:hypothetical protein